MYEVKLCEKYLLSVAEIIAYFGIGETKVRELLNSPNNDFTVLNGNKLLANRKRLEKYFDTVKSI